MKGKCYGIITKATYEYTYNMGLYNIFHNGVLVYSTNKKSFDMRFVDVNKKRNELIDILLSE